MNQPHFLRAGHVPSSLRHKRRFRGRLVIDTPPAKEGLPELIDGLKVPSLDQLREMMNHQPPMPEERAAEIRRKLDEGEYLTRKAAETSADRILDDAEFVRRLSVKDSQSADSDEKLF